MKGKWIRSALGQVELYDITLGAVKWFMLNWIVRNRTVWSFNWVYRQNVFTNHIFNKCVKTGFSIK